MCVILHQGFGGRGLKSLNCLKSLKIFVNPKLFKPETLQTLEP
jgi:hypothetical protein